MPDGRPVNNQRGFGPIASLCVALCLACLAAVPGCSEHENKEDSSDDASGQLVHVYQLRGRIVSLPDPADPASELRIHHEKIDDFKNFEGEVVGMNAMTMSFPPAPGVSLDGLAVGDAVEFEFRMVWEPSASMSTTSISKLPADTKLDFETANEDADDHAGH